MSEIIGRQIELGVTVEQTRGTPQAVAEKWLKKITANIRSRAEHAIDESSHGVLEDSDGRRVIKKWIEGDVEGNLHIDAIGYFLYNIFGSISSSWVASGVYSHVFTLAQSIQHASLAIFAKDGGAQQKVFNNAMVGSLQIQAAMDGIVRFTASIMAKTEATNSDTPSYDTEYDFIGKDITVKMADTEAGLSGATAIKAKDLNITFDQGIISDYVFGSYNPDDIYNGKMSIEGEMTLNFEDTTYKDLYLADTNKYMQIQIAGTTDIGGGNYPTITILLYKVRISDWDRSGGNDELVTQKVSFKAFYNSTDSKQSQVTVKNNTAEYSSAPSA